MKYFPILLIIIALFKRFHAGTKTKCEVVKALRDQGVLDTDLRDWLCLVEHESSYRYDYIKDNLDKTADYGLFQINSKFNCDQPHGYNGTTCWKINTFGCEDACASLSDSDITNDAHCAVRIQRCGGFERWFGWKDNCTDVTSSSYDYSNC